MLANGDHVICGDDVYGGTNRILNRNFVKFGIQVSMIELTPENFAKTIKDNTKLLIFETPTNPTLKIVDIEALCEVAKAKGIISIVDNTFASPYLQSPLLLGADVVIHSGTKYIGGHSDVVHGAVVTNSELYAQKLKFIQNAVGAVPGPQDCCLILRGIKTLHIRVERACQNAAKIADFLRSHSKIKQVFYPGFIDHPGHDIAASQMRHFGGMVSFNLFTDTLDYAEKLLSNTTLFTLAESLGGVESLIGHPATMTHASIPREERLKVGLTDSLIRLSVGIEDVSDLIDDLNVAIDHLP
jgi:cystathionine beta-lyase/cystathionine gamma-synthase